MIKYLSALTLHKPTLLCGSVLKRSREAAAEQQRRVSIEVNESSI